MLLPMKWFLCLLLIGVGFYAYNQSQELDATKTSLKQSEDTIADLKRQLQGTAQTRPGATAAAPIYAPTPAARPSWMNTTSDLDKTPVPAHGRR
jgi:hypothetical protein